MANHAELAHHLLTLATLRLLSLSPEGTFSHVRAIPLQVLTHLTDRYLQLLGSRAAEIANQSGRTAPNARDAALAIEEYGGSVSEVWEWCQDRRLGGEGVQMASTGPVHPASLGALLRDSTRTEGTSKAAQVIEYRPLRSDEEREAIAVLRSRNMHLQPTADSPDSPASSSSSPPPTAEQTAVQYRPSSEDRMSFLPPLPDLTAGLDTIQTIQEDESGRTIKRARRAIEGTGAHQSASNAASWHRSIPFESSALAEYADGSKPLPEVSGSLDIVPIAPMEEEAAEASSSLVHFLETFNFISTDPHLAGGPDALPLRHNPKRKRAATAIHSNILNPSDDSLSGAIPTPLPRNTRKNAGWLPYPPLANFDPADPLAGKTVQPFPPLHPFTSNALPASMTEALPTNPLPHPTKVFAPIQHPRVPTLNTSIRTLLESHSALNAALFNKTTRFPPPGPLLENGASGFYAVELEKPVIQGWPSEIPPRMMSYNFDWEVGNELEEPTPLAKQGSARQGSQPQKDGGATKRSGVGAINGQPPAGSTSGTSGPVFPGLPNKQQQLNGGGGHSRRASTTQSASLYASISSSSGIPEGDTPMAAGDGSELAAPDPAPQPPFVQSADRVSEGSTKMESYFDGFLDQAEAGDTTMSEVTNGPPFANSDSEFVKSDPSSTKDHGAAQSVAEGSSYPPDPYGQSSKIVNDAPATASEPTVEPLADVNYPPDPYGQQSSSLDATTDLERSESARRHSNGFVDRPIEDTFALEMALPAVIATNGESDSQLPTVQGITAGNSDEQGKISQQAETVQPASHPDADPVDGEAAQPGDGVSSAAQEAGGHT